MDFALTGLRIRAVVVASFLCLLVTEVTGECIVSEPLRVHRVCGQVLLKGSSLPGTLSLTARDGKAGAKPFKQIGKTNDEGQFDFKDLPAGNYEMRLTPVGMSEVSVPVLVDLRHPQRDGACVKPIDLKLDFLPEACVSPELRKTKK
jgi:hypothetical protein